jgi:hypothetical protein
VAACCPVGYSPRHTVHSDLCRIVREHLPGFVELTERDGTTLPGFVLAELEGLLSSTKPPARYARFVTGKLTGMGPRSQTCT